VSRRKAESFQEFIEKCEKRCESLKAKLVNLDHRKMDEREHHKESWIDLQAVESALQVARHPMASDTEAVTHMRAMVTMVSPRERMTFSEEYDKLFPLEANRRFNIVQYGQLTAALIALSRTATQVANITLKEVGLSIEEYLVLAALAENPGANQDRLSALSGINRNRMVWILDRLSRRGLSERRKNKLNRREHNVFLSEPGRSKLKEVNTQEEQRSHLSFDPLVVVALSTALQRLI
jgi:DNA-binding MarR family transcriptional regulator